MNLKVGGSVATCTATVLGPYAVLSANHCTSGQSPSGMSINYTDLGDLAVGNVFYNPYLNASPRPSTACTRRAGRSPTASRCTATTSDRFRASD
jgi:hypothetical protein